LKQKLVELEQLWGVEPKQLHQHLHSMGPTQAAAFMQHHQGILNQLDEVRQLLGSENYPLLSDHHDVLEVREQSYGKYEKPADYLDSFAQFVKEQINQSAALSVVVNKPRDLTRQQLREIRIMLDGAGYSEASLRSAWRNNTNQDIAASIIGHIRQAALGEALLSFEQRVQNAMQQIYSQHSWTPAQRNWLDRLSKQLTHEVIIDREAISVIPAFSGGAKQLDKALGQKLDMVLDGLNDSLWKSA
jgi:type I restriction enzyme R subunit